MATSDRLRLRDGFDFTGAMRRLCSDMVARLPELLHIDFARVAVSFRQTRNASRCGIFASLTPLRFPGGALEAVRRGRRWRYPRLIGPDGRDWLYILNFYLPRFLNLSFSEKLETIVHELWHIGPNCDGDLRRHSGRCFAHGSSQKRYDARLRPLVRAYLDSQPPEDLYAFLRSDFAALLRQHGRVVGQRFPVPKLQLVDQGRGPIDRLIRP